MASVSVAQGGLLGGAATLQLVYDDVALTLTSFTWANNSAKSIEVFASEAAKASVSRIVHPGQSGTVNVSATGYTLAGCTYGCRTA